MTFTSLSLTWTRPLSDGRGPCYAQSHFRPPIRIPPFQLRSHGTGRMTPSSTPTKIDSTKDLLRTIDWFSVVGALLLLVICFLAYSALAETDGSVDWKEFCKGLIVNLVPVFALFIASYLVFRNVQGIKQQQFMVELSEKVRLTMQSPIVERFRDVPWDSLIRDAKKIDIAVHYFDTWINDRPDALKEFLRRKDAKLRILLPDPSERTLLSILLPRFPELNAETLRHKIENTSSKLLNLRDEAKAPKASVKIVTTKTLQWYCVVRFDDTVAVLSIYENARIGGTRAPAVIVDLARHAKVAEWLEREFESLFTGGEAPQPQAPQKDPPSPMPPAPSATTSTPAELK